MAIGTTAAILGSAAISAGSSALAASKAAKAQRAAAEQGAASQQQQIDESRRQFDLQRGDLAPYREAGTASLADLVAGTRAGGQFDRTFSAGDFAADPGYQFRLDEGNKAIDRSAASRGGLYSGGTLKALAGYNQGLAAQEYGAAYDRFNQNQSTRFNRLASLAGVGQTALAQGQQASGQFLSSTGNARNNISDLMTQAGNARASGYVGAGNAISGLAGQIGQYSMLQDMMKKQATLPISASFNNQMMG